MKLSTFETLSINELIRWANLMGITLSEDVQKGLAKLDTIEGEISSAEEIIAASLEPPDLPDSLQEDLTNAEGNSRLLTKVGADCLEWVNGGEKTPLEEDALSHSTGEKDVVSGWLRGRILDVFQKAGHIEPD